MRPLLFKRKLVKNIWKYPCIKKETRTIKGRNNVKPGSVDGHVNEEDISQQVFGGKYNNLYNNIPHSENDMYSIKTGHSWQVEYE